MHRPGPVEPSAPHPGGSSRSSRWGPQGTLLPGWTRGLGLQRGQLLPLQGEAAGSRPGSPASPDLAGPGLTQPGPRPTTCRAQEARPQNQRRATRLHAHQLRLQASRFPRHMRDPVLPTSPEGDLGPEGGAPTVGEHPRTAPLLSGKPCSGEEEICTGGWVGIQSRVVSHAWEMPMPSASGAPARGRSAPGSMEEPGSWRNGARLPGPGRQLGGGAGERSPPCRMVGGWTWRQDPSPHFCTQLHAAPSEQGHVMSPGTLCVGLRGWGRPGLGVQGPPAPAGPLGKQQTRSAREYPGLWRETDAWGG